MSEAAQRAGMPLEHWLRSQLFGTTAAGTGASASGPVGNVAELQRRIEELAGQIDQLGGGARPAAEAPVPAAAVQAPSLSPEMASPVPAPLSTGSAYADERLEAAIREIDQRLESMHLTRPREAIQAAPLGTATAAPAASTSPGSIEAAVAEIAARQHELDKEFGARRRSETVAREPVAREPLHREPLAREPVAREPRAAAPARENVIRDTISERFIRDPFANGPFPTRATTASTTTATPPSPVTQAPMTQAPATPGTASPARSSSINETLVSLQGELGGMRQSLTLLAPRRAVDELQRVVQQLADRVERSGTRDEDLRCTLVALRDMISGLKLPEHPALLFGRIDALERKLDIVNAKMVDGATMARLQSQATEIRELLARTLSSDSVRLLAEQVSLLATKVSEVAANEDRAIRTAVGSLERRIDTLADKIGNQPAPTIPLDDLVSRLDAIQSGLASARREMPAGMEALIKGLSDRIERIERPIALPDDGPRFDALGRQIGELTQKIEKAVAGAEVASQLAGIERAVNDLFIQMEETRATFLAAGPRARPPSGNGGGPIGGAARIRREIASVEASREAAAPDEVPAASVATSAPAATTPVVVPVAAAPAPAAPAPAAPEVAFAPPPASIPKPFEPQLMRAALEELNRSAEAAVALRAQPGRASEPQTPAAPRNEPHHAASRAEAVLRVEAASPAPTLIDDEFDFRPVDLDAEAAARGITPSTEPPAGAAGAPSRAAFIAQARRATKPANVVAPELRSHIAERHRRKPGRWLARIRAMLFIGLCGSALAYGSWHLLAQLREAQLRAAAPAASSTAKLPPAARPAPPSSTPAPEDITGSVGKPAPRAQPPVDAPAGQPPAPTPIGPSSLSLPTELPGGIASQTLRAAALAGDPGAAFEIARRFMDGEGVAPSAARAAEWYAYASTNGSVPAAYRLGTIYEKGMEGVPRDVAKARELYEQAAKAGNVAAMHNLGVMLASGVDGQPDYRTAAAWFTRAAERGVRDSQYNLAVLYARGFGVAANPMEAWRWFALAAARGDSEAATKRDEIAARLDARTLATARQEVESWAPLLVDAKANDTTAMSLADGTPRKTASR